jgi:hypothetical protein
MARPDTWAAVAYFLLVAWGIMFSLAGREGDPSMWRLPKSKPKRGALGVVVSSIVLGGPFVNHLAKAEICGYVLVLIALLLYGFSDYLGRDQRNIAAFCLTVSIGSICILLIAWHFWPSVKRLHVFRDAYFTDVGNLPERSKVTYTWDGEPWKENQDNDVRLTIEDNDEAIQGLYLTINVPDPRNDKIAGIGQLTDIPNVEIIPPEVPETVVHLRGADGKSHAMPLSLRGGKGWGMPVASLTIFVPRLARAETVKIILATVHHGQNRIPPDSIRITGTGDVSEGDVIHHAVIDDRANVTK